MAPPNIPLYSSKFFNWNWQANFAVLLSYSNPCYTILIIQLIYCPAKASSEFVPSHWDNIVELFFSFFQEKVALIPLGFHRIQSAEIVDAQRAVKKLM